MLEQIERASLLTWWQAYAAVEPFGEARADLRNALVCAVFGNAHRRKGQRAFRLEDFRLDRFLVRKAKAAVGPLIEFFAHVTHAFGGEDRRDGRSSSEPDRDPPPR